MKAPAEAFPPGEYLRDELNARSWTETEFAEILGRPVQTISEILNGRKQITPETALAVGEALGTTAELWINLQTYFNLYKARSDTPPTTEVTRRSRLRSCVPVNELRNRGWLPDTKDPDILEAAIKELLHISDLDEEPPFTIAARRSNPRVSFTPQQTAWLARFRNIAAYRRVKSFNASAVTILAADLSHRIETPLDLGKLEKWFADTGVILVNLLPLKASKLDGASMILDTGNPAIGLTTRGDRMDSYVFTLLHEVAHIQLGHLSSFQVRADENIMDESGLESAEVEANRQASEWILPNTIDFPARTSMETINLIARSYGIHPCFVIGRLQRSRNNWSLLRRSIPKVRPFVDAEN
jgi:HTH-type transcriptional regulator/antitoxin HigA